MLSRMTHPPRQTLVPLLFSLSIILSACPNVSSNSRSVEGPSSTAHSIVNPNPTTPSDSQQASPPHPAFPDTLPAATPIPTSIDQNTTTESTHPASTPRTNCDPAFILISNTPRTNHIYQVKNFDPGSFSCWTALEREAIRICSNQMPCVVTFLDTYNITKNTTPPYFVDEPILREYGIGHFDFKNQWWELRGAKIWGRTQTGYEYYNSNRY